MQFFNNIFFFLDFFAAFKKYKKQEKIGICRKQQKDQKVSTSTDMKKRKKVFDIKKFAGKIYGLNTFL